MTVPPPNLILLKLTTSNSLDYLLSRLLLRLILKSTYVQKTEC